MTATTLTKAQKNLPQLVDDVNDSCRPVIIVNEGSGKNAVLVSEDDWNSIQETMYLYSIPGMVESIIEAGKEPLSECRIYDPDEEW
ncbi:MAG: type II toxin-antitoxin system Phd/YefM family antitoxin [Synergistaceae bacterium]|nr:type II toxin-antitoxin system Phd/YefM family antitoxin [Synergistaceae bacterium]